MFSDEDAPVALTRYQRLIQTFQAWADEDTDSHGNVQYIYEVGPPNRDSSKL